MFLGLPVFMDWLFVYLLSNTSLQIEPLNSILLLPGPGSFYFIFYLYPAQLRELRAGRVCGFDKELCINHKSYFLTLISFSTWCHKSLILKTLTIWLNITHSLKYQWFTTSGGLLHQVSMIYMDRNLLFVIIAQLLYFICNVNDKFSLTKCSVH